MKAEIIESATPNERTKNTELRQLINKAMHKGQLRAGDCRHALRLQAAGMPPSMIIEYIQTMITYTARTRAKNQ